MTQTLSGHMFAHLKVRLESVLDFRRFRIEALHVRGHIFDIIADDVGCFLIGIS